MDDDLKDTYTKKERPQCQYCGTPLDDDGRCPVCYPKSRRK